MCKKRILLVLLLLGTIFVVTACGATIIKGSGNLITETRQVSNFDSIDLSGSGEVIVTQGGSESLTIETDDNVMEHVKAEVVGAAILNVKLTREKRSKMGLHEPVICTQTGGELARERKESWICG